MDSGHGRETLGEDAAAIGVGAEEAAHFDVEAHRPVLTGQVGKLVGGWLKSSGSKA
jgi:hypothetical protein